VDDGGDFFRQELVLAAAARFSADPNDPGATAPRLVHCRGGHDRLGAWRLCGYAIGYFLFDAVGRPVLEFYHAMDKYEALKGGFAQWGA
jgi:hypothetical protein